jgi:hypothetical protein
MFLSITAILIVDVFVIKYINITWIAVVISTACSCFLMVPITLSFNNFVDSRVGKKEIISENQATVVKQNMVIEGLKNTIRNLESTMFNVQGFEKILELGLLETNLKQSTITRERFEEKFSNGLLKIGAGGEYYEYLEVMTHDIIAKFGVNLKSMRLSNSKQRSDTIVVSGITPKFLGTTKNDSKTEIREIRRTTVDGKNKEKKVDIMESTQHEKLKARYAEESQRKYQERLNQGLETKFMDESVIKLAESFIKLILAPLNKNIVFSDTERDDGVLLLEYLDMEKQSINIMLENKRVELLSIANERDI